MKKTSIDLTGIGQIKAKAVKKGSSAPEVMSINKKAEKSAKMKQRPKRITSVKNSKPKSEKRKPIVNSRTSADEITFRKNLTEHLFSDIKDEYSLSSFSVYYADNGDFPRKIHGDELESEIVIERCLSYINPVVVVNPNGITDNRIYKSRYITRVYTGDGFYLICVSSYSIEAFRNNGGERITKRIYEMMGGND